MTQLEAIFIGLVLALAVLGMLWVYILCSSRQTVGRNLNSMNVLYCMVVLLVRQYWKPTWRLPQHFLDKIIRELGDPPDA